MPVGTATSVRDIYRTFQRVDVAVIDCLELPQKLWDAHSNHHRALQTFAEFHLVVSLDALGCCRATITRHWTSEARSNLVTVVQPAGEEE